MVKDFSKGKIYKLTAGDLTYYGSTVRTLNVRFDKHKSDARKNKGISSQKLFQSGDEVKIHLVENYPCKTKKELREREGYYQLNFECVNKNIAGRTITEYHKQYYEDNKEYCIQKAKQYYEENKEDRAEKKKQYYEDNKEAILEKQKQGYKDNRETIAEKAKEYRKNNRDRINAYYSEKIQCECGCMVSRRNIARHRESPQHKKNIDSL